MKTNAAAASTLSIEAKDRLLNHFGEPWLLSGWRDAVFLHFAVKPEHLQPFVPFPLDLYNGMAYVSCVAFTMRHMRPRLGCAFLLKPIATHEFLNVRTYVTTGGECGIYFLAEWLPNKLSVLLGPAVFGLPYRHGLTHYQHDDSAQLEGRVEDTATGAQLHYTAAHASHETAHEAEAESLDEFLLERYTAFTSWCGLKRLFRVWHPPWKVQRLNVDLHAFSLLDLTGAWSAHATYHSAHYARGFDEVWMSRPRFSFSTPNPN